MEDLNRKQEPQHYKNYVGQYGKRFYAKFDSDSIRKIDGFSDTRRSFAEFHFEGDPEDYWFDCEDTTIITNEMPMLEIPWVANVNNEEYLPQYYNPFK